MNLTEKRIEQIVMEHAGLADVTCFREDIRALVAAAKEETAKKAYQKGYEDGHASAVEDFEENYELIPKY